MGLESSEFPWKPFLWPSPHVTSQVGCNQTPTGQRMSSQTAIPGFHSNCLHFLFKLVISPQVFLLPIRRLVGREKVGTGTQALPGPLGEPHRARRASPAPGQILLARGDATTRSTLRCPWGRPVAPRWIRLPTDVQPHRPAKFPKAC